MAENKITVPFIYSSPEVGRITFPLKGLFGTVLIVMLVLILGGIVHNIVQANESSKEFLFLLIYAAIGFVFLIMVVNFLLDHYICEHIIIEGNNLIYKDSKILSGGSERAYQMGSDSKLVWSIERTKIKYMELHYSQLVFYDVESKDNVLIRKFVIGQGYNRSWIKFLNVLAKASGLKIEKEEMPV